VADECKDLFTGGEILYCMSDCCLLKDCVPLDLLFCNVSNYLAGYIEFLILTILEEHILQLRIGC
jgi:hypothetical protein